MEIDLAVLSTVDGAAEKIGMSRQKLIEAILRQVLAKKFVLKL